MQSHCNYVELLTIFITLLAIVAHLMAKLAYMSLSRAQKISIAEGINSIVLTHTHQLTTSTTTSPHFKGLVTK